MDDCLDFGFQDIMEFVAGTEQPEVQTGPGKEGRANGMLQAEIGRAHV